MTTLAQKHATRRAFARLFARDCRLARQAITTTAWTAAELVELDRWAVETLLIAWGVNSHVAPLRPFAPDDALLPIVRLRRFCRRRLAILAQKRRGKR